VPSVSIVGTRGYPSFYGGFETAVRHLAPYLADVGWDVTVYGRRNLVTRTDIADPRVTTRETSGVDSKSLSTLTYGLSACVDASWAKPDVTLIMNCAHGFYLPAFRLRGVPTLVNVDGMEWERAKWGRLARFTFKAGAVLTGKWADEILVDAHEIGRRWQDEFNRSGVWAPYGGEARNPLPVESGLTHHGYALAVARLVPENSIPEFIEAARIIARQHPVVLVGSSGFGGALDEAAHALDAAVPDFHWLGHLADDDRLHSLWQHAGAYFHGHSVGGTNPALVQAMTLGAPTIARDTVYNREVLGNTGWFTEATPDAIAASILRLLDDPAARAELSSAAAERAKKTYSWQSVCERYDVALRDLLKVPTVGLKDLSR